MKRFMRRHRGGALLLSLLCALALVASVLLISSCSSGRQGTQMNQDREWNLILVNADNPVPDGYTCTLTELSNGTQVDSRIYPQLQAMFDDARSQGLELFVADGYRTRAEQQQMMDERVQLYMNEGVSRRNAREIARDWVAEPGHSEHELGLAVDINANTELCSSDEVYAWLANNAHEYGFIKRYPADKSDITGIANEPWHYRYVGVEAAREMYAGDLCLEEYLQLLDEEAAA